MGELLSGIVGAALGFLGGFFGDLVKRVMPSYQELLDENRSLRQEVIALHDQLEDMRDTLQDEGE